MNKKCLVLTSTQNFVWHSMQEIIPFIVETWQAAESESTQVRVVNIDKEKLADYFKDLIECSAVVLTCFTPQMFKLAAYIRGDLKLGCNFIVYLHNQATIACWPMRHWGAVNLFQKKDFFISSCARDAECLKITFPEARCKIIPFSYKDISSESIFSKPDEVEIPLIYIGRISSQKNIHTTLLALKILKKQRPELRWTLHVYGKEDNLGSPNMGISQPGYQQFLLDLCDTLKIKENVFFHGYQDREHLKDVLKQRRHVLISPSLHSDENFGMAAFQCLIANHTAVLSDWGGHADFKKHFDNQTELVKVYKTSKGPSIDPAELAKAILKSIERYRDSRGTLTPEYYSFGSIVKKNKELLAAETGTEHSLRATEISDEIYKRATCEKIKGNPKIFNTYKDEQAQIFFEAYGMKHDLPRLNSELGYSIVPWVEKNKKSVLIKDYHRGQETLCEDKNLNNKLYELGHLYRTDKL